VDEEVRQLVQAIHDSPGRVMMVVAGAGAQALAWLLGVAGASRTLLEALIPYESASFDRFLGQTPKQYVAASTAGLLAGRAMARARELRLPEEPVFGLACTATIVTDRPKRGEHRAHITAWTAEAITHANLTLCKGERDRLGEEEMVSRLILSVLAADAFCLPMRLPLALIPGDSLQQDQIATAALVDELLRGGRHWFGITPEGSAVRGLPGALLSGSFNPLHEGHLALAQAASEVLGTPVIFELSAINADKPPLPRADILARLLQFAGCEPCLVSDAPTFVAKARLYPGATFVVGFDTAERVLQIRFYGNSQAQLLAALAEIRERGCGFLVAGRTDEQGEFHEAAELRPPAGFAGLFRSIPGALFRRDISSTRLRAEGKEVTA
jgi:hypothetical protein